jgi:tetratricopeptide (TPR) repeat protein
MALALAYDDPQAVQLLEEAAAIARQANSPILSGMLVNLSGHLEHVGRLADARAVGPEMADAARRFGNARRVFELAMMECNWALSAGGWAAAEQQATEWMENAPSPWDRVSVLSIRIQLRIALGTLEPALADIEEYDRFAGSTGEPQLLEIQYAQDALCHASLGHTELAAQAVDRWCAMDQQGAAEVNIWVATGAWLAGHTEPFVSRAPQSASSPWYEAATAIAGGQLGPAADILQRIGSLSNEALTRLLWAEHLAGEGRHAEAAPHLERALEIYQAEGATNRIVQAKAISARAAS